MDHISEIAKVTCKVCRISLRRKNYKFHLKNTHPKENSDYLSGLSQPKITSLLPQSTSSHSRKNTVVPQLGDDVEDAGTEITNKMCVFLQNPNFLYDCHYKSYLSSKI